MVGYILVILIGGYIMKKLFIAFMSVFLIGCTGLSGMEQTAASSSSATTAPITTATLPDISSDSEKADLKRQAELKAKQAGEDLIAEEEAAKKRKAEKQKAASAKKGKAAAKRKKKGKSKVKEQDEEPKSAPKKQKSTRTKQKGGEPAPSTLSAITGQIATEQEEQREVSFSACAYPDQGAATSSAAAEDDETSWSKKTTKQTTKYKKKSIAKYPANSPVVIDILPYTDGKVLPSEEGYEVVIDDPCNEMRLFLYPSDKCESINYKYKLKYKENVLIWFSSAKKAFFDQGYLDPVREKYAGTASEQIQVVRIHRFSKLVDGFISKMGIRRSVTSRIPGETCDVTEITIKGEVKFYKEKTPRQCLFVYLIDAKDKCFHRNIQF